MKELINPVEITAYNSVVNINFIKHFDEKLCKRNSKLYKRYTDDLRVVIKQYVHAPRKSGLTWRIQESIDKITRDYIHRESDFLLVLSEVSNGL